MNGFDIFTEMQKIDDELNESFDPSTFVLNKKYQSLLKRKQELQEQCPHDFENGVCSYCGLKQEQER